MATTITLERADTPDARTLIAELDALLEPLYPPDNRFGYSVDKIIKQGVHFFVVRVDDVPAGCGGIQFVENEFGELKRMYIRPQFRGMGLAKQLLNHLQDKARAHNVALLRLETGIHQTDAIAMYEKFGFYRIAPFGVYTDDPSSRCYEKKIEPAEQTNDATD